MDKFLTDLGFNLSTVVWHLFREDGKLLAVTNIGHIWYIDYKTSLEEKHFHEFSGFQDEVKDKIKEILA